MLTEAQADFFDRIMPEPNSGCWMWMGVRHKQYGYGWINISEPIAGDRTLIGFAHRVSWMVHRGPIPHKLHVCHKCDTPCCANPDHLFVGTYKDNLDDARRKGRMPWRGVFGERHGATKLTDKEVAEIRAMKPPGRSPYRYSQKIAAKYGIVPAYVWQIWHTTTRTRTSYDR